MNRSRYCTGCVADVSTLPYTAFLPTSSMRFKVFHSCRQSIIPRWQYTPYYSSDATICKLFSNLLKICSLGVQLSNRNRSQSTITTSREQSIRFISQRKFASLLRLDCSLSFASWLTLNFLSFASKFLSFRVTLPQFVRSSTAVTLSNCDPFKSQIFWMYSESAWDKLRCTTKWVGANSHRSPRQNVNTPYSNDRSESLLRRVQFAQCCSLFSSVSSSSSEIVLMTSRLSQVKKKNYPDFPLSGPMNCFIRSLFITRSNDSPNWTIFWSLLRSKLKNFGAQLLAYILVLASSCAIPKRSYQQKSSLPRLNCYFRKVRDSSSRSNQGCVILPTFFEPSALLSRVIPLRKLSMVWALRSFLKSENQFSVSSIFSEGATQDLVRKPQIRRSFDLSSGSWALTKVRRMGCPTLMVLMTEVTYLREGRPNFCWFYQSMIRLTISMELVMMMMVTYLRQQAQKSSLYFRKSEVSGILVLTNRRVVTDVIMSMMKMRQRKQGKAFFSLMAQTNYKSTPVCPRRQLSKGNRMIPRIDTL